MSPSSRRAWIEIGLDVGVFLELLVALLAEGVDRNGGGWVVGDRPQVALLAEGVDRNWTPCTRRRTNSKVALLAEGVDRNIIHTWLRA